MSVRIFPPHPLLSDQIHSLLVTTLPGDRYTLPATLQPVLVATLRGAIWVDGPGGSAERVPAISLHGGAAGPRSGTGEAGTQVLMVSVKAGRLRRLLGLPAGAVREDVVSLDALLPRAAFDEVTGRLAEAADLDEGVAAFQRLLLGQRATFCDRAPDLVVPPGWIDCPVGELADRLGVGARQFERRFIESYGRSLRAYRNQRRCSRLVTSLLDGSREDDWAAIAAEAGYFDQAHLSREVRRFTGHTPTELLRGMTGHDPVMWPYRFSAAQMVSLFGDTGDY